VTAGVPSGQLVLAALLLAAAVLALPARSASTRHRLGSPVAVPPQMSARFGPVLPIVCGLAVGSLAAVLIGDGSGAAVGAVVGVMAVLAARRWTRSPAAEPPTEPLRLAGAWDLLAACLRAGLPVATATRAVAEQLPGRDGGVLRSVAELLASGADAAEAWEPALANPSTAPLAMAARRTARSGAAMAGAVTELAGQVRAAAADLAEERAQRAGVLVTGPLGLCFLPAFFCLGVLPVVIGLADQLIQRW
jgi:pilus assembly protein TadC